MSCAPWRSAAPWRWASLPNLPDPSAPTGRRGAARGGRGRPHGAQPRGAAGRAPRHGGGRARGRLALRLPEGPARAPGAGARAVGAHAARGEGLHAGGAARAGARGGPVWHRHAARHRAADLQRARRRPVSSRARARCRWPRCTPARSSSPATLPLRYAGFSPCFRREAGAAGKDTQGIFRVHQFDKVEMFTFVERERVAGRARAAAGDRGGDPPGALEIPYRVVNIAVDDLGNSAAKKYDLEAWLPGQEPLPRAHLVLQHHGLPGTPPRHPPAPGTRARTPRPRAHAQRHGGGGGADDHRRSPRTTSARTARWRCPRCCTTSAHRRRSRCAPLR